MIPVNETASKRNRVLAAALFWGTLWGLWEATAGHLVHLVRIPGLPGILMAPAALFFLTRAVRAGGTPGAAFLTGCVAAGMKLLDLLIPGRNILAVVNPAQFILLESLIVTVFYALRATRINLGRAQIDQE
jgi:hypothetical protein